MEYIPELKSVDMGGGAGQGGSRNSSGRAGIGKLLRPAVFFTTGFLVLAAVFWGVGLEPVAALLLAFGLSAVFTLMAALYLGTWRIADFAGGRSDGLTPQQYAVGFDLLATLMDRMPAVFIVKDRSHRYILVNDTMGEWAALKAKDFIGKRVDEVSWWRNNVEEMQRIREEDEYVLTTERPLDRFVVVPRADGTEIKMLAKRFPIRSRDGDVVAIGSTNIDVTELEEARQEYQEARRERDRQTAIFQNFFEALPFPAAMKGVDGRFLSVNSKLLEWHTFPDNDVIGRRIEEIVGPELAEASIALDAKVLESGKPDSIERTQVFYDGVERIVRILRFPLIAEDGELLGLGLFNIDVSEQRAAERLLQDNYAELERLVGERTAELEQTNCELTRALDELKATTDVLIETDRMASLGSMVAGMAHEINTPIGVGVTAASLVRDKVEAIQNDLDAGTLTRDGMAAAMSVIDEASDVMLRNMSRADSLIRSLKQVAVDQTNMETRDVDLERYIREVEMSIAPVLAKAGVTVQLDCRPGLWVRLQPGPLAQVMTNLLMNCINHAYPDGEGGVIHIGTALTDDGVILRFRDFGVGMDQETLGQIFVPFFTTRRNKGGTGLGLSIVYNVVRSILGGDIDCDSAPGKGTVFTVTLPLSCVVDQAE